MRGVVSYYDGHSSFSSGKKRITHHHDGSSTQNHQLILDLKDKISECNRLSQNLAQAHEETHKLRADKEKCLGEIHAIKSDLEKRAQECASLQKDIDLMRTEIEKLQSRTLPEDALPAMIWYAMGDVSGAALRKVSVTKMPESVYKITTLPGDTSSAYFEPFASNLPSFVLENYRQSLAACELVAISASPAKIMTLEPGKARFAGGKWNITHKAKIKLL